MQSRTQTIYYDNLGETYDRYTAFRWSDKREDTASLTGLTFSYNADQPNGVSILCDITVGEHLGVQITPFDLPNELLAHVNKRLDSIA